MKNIYHLVKKNLKLLIREKSSALIVILAPLMIILLVGISYNTTDTGLNIGVYAPQFTSEINSFLTTLQEENYKTIKYTEVDECIDDIKLGFTHTCLALPKDFQVKDNKPKEITFYIDQSKINLVYIITNKINEKFNTKSKEISENIVSGILAKISTTQNTLKSKTAEVDKAKKTNQEASLKSDSIKSELASLDLNVSSTTTTNGTASVDKYKSTTTSTVSSAINSLNDARSLVSSSNINGSDKSEIYSKIDSAKTKLTGIKTSLNTTGNNSFGEVTALINSLKKDITNTQSKLDLASQKITTSGTGLTTISSSLKQSVSALDGVKKALETIQKDLGSQKVTDVSTISTPLNTKIEKITVDNTNLGYMFPSLMILVVMFISLLLGTTLVMMEKHNPAYFRNFIVPVRKITFVFSTYLTTIFIIFIQILIILGISLIFLEGFLAQIPLTALILFLSASIFSLIGMAIGYLFISEDTGTLASISIGSLLLFVSGVVLPLESMPTAIRKITSFNPFVIGEKLIRETFIFNSSFMVMVTDILVMVGYSLILFLMILIIDNISGRHFLTKAVYKHRKKIKEKNFKHKKIAVS